jgi:hypothetical protein
VVLDTARRRSQPLELSWIWLWLWETGAILAAAQIQAPRLRQIASHCPFRSSKPIQSVSQSLSHLSVDTFVSPFQESISDANLFVFPFSAHFLDVRVLVCSLFRTPSRSAPLTPPVQAGTLSSLLTLSDTLPKTDSTFTTTVSKTLDTIRTLLNDPSQLSQHARVNDRPAEEFVIPSAAGGAGYWRWDRGRWGEGRKVGEVLEDLARVSARCDRVVGRRGYKAMGASRSGSARSAVSDTALGAKGVHISIPTPAFWRDGLHHYLTSPRRGLLETEHLAPIPRVPTTTFGPLISDDHLRPPP